jgi:hypothetical protein
MKSQGTYGRWGNAGIQVALLTVSFALGWLSVSRDSAHAPQGTKGQVESASAKSNEATTNDLAQEKSKLAQMLRLPDRLDRERMILDYVETLNASDTQALLAEFATKPLTASTRELLPYLACHWAELDPDSALTWLQAVPNKQVQGLCANEIFDAYSAKDAPAAFSTLTKLPANYNFSQLSVTVLSNYAEQDPHAALVALQNASNHNLIFSSLPSIVFDQWSQQDPAAAAAALTDLPVGTPQRSSLRSVAQSWAKQDPTAALAWANTLPDGQSQAVATNLILNTYSAEDPAAAANYVLANSSSAPGPALLTIVQNWAAADPSALLTWANQNLTGQPYNRAAIQALRQLGNTDPAAAAAYLAQNPDPNVLAQATPALAGAWGQQDPQAALAWAQSLPSDNVSLRNSAISQAISGWVAVNPAAAAAYIQQNFANNPDFGNMTSNLATAWGATDPQAALQWAKSLPPDVQGSVAIAAMAQLAKVDPQAGSNAAQAALGSLPSLTQDQQTALQKIIDDAASH